MKMEVEVRVTCLSALGMKEGCKANKEDSLHILGKDNRFFPFLQKEHSPAKFCL